jgi:hypothetical protein
MLTDVPPYTVKATSELAEARPVRRNRLKRWVTVFVGGLLFLLIAGVLGFRIGVQILKGKVVESLGVGSEVAELKVGWSSIVLVGASIHGPRGWPAAQTFHAKRVTIVPSLRTLLTPEPRIASITIEDPYLSVVRVPGKLVILPSLLESSSRKGKKESSRSVGITKIVLHNGVMEVFDTTVSQPPLKIRLEKIEAVVRDIAPANPQNRIGFELAAIAKGKSRDGQVRVSGWVGAAGKDSSSHIVMDHVDLVSLQPYIVKRGDTRVSKGTLDLNLKSEVRANQLDGVGKMILRDLEFAPSQNYMGTFMGVPRSAVIGFLKDHDNAINLDFILSGDIRHPNFSLNESLATRVAAGAAGKLGVSVEGVAEGLEGLGRRGLEGASGTANAIGSLFKDLFR